MSYGDPGYPDWLSGLRDVYEYNDEKIKHDLSVSYKSEKYPFLEAVHKYSILSHQPHDYDHISLQIPGMHGPGHYIVYYHWRGYTNCVDVNFHEDLIPEEEINGVLMDEPEFEKIDHCQFTNFDAITSPIYNASMSAKDSMDYMFSHPIHANTVRNGVGINVVPMKLPKGVFQPTADMLPWRDSRRSPDDALSMLRLDPDTELGPVYRTDNSASILRRLRFKVVAKGKFCANTVDITSFAIHNWGGIKCLEVSHTDCDDDDFRRIVEGASTYYDSFDRFPVKNMAFYNQTRPRIQWHQDSNGKNFLSTCTQSDELKEWTRENSKYTVLEWDWSADGARKEYDRLSAPASVSDNDTIRISFQPSWMSVPEGWYSDSGKTFSQKNKDGWMYSVQRTENCQHPLTLEECQSLGASLTYNQVRHGNSLAGGNKGFADSRDDGRDRPPGCYFFYAKQTVMPDEPNLMYNTYVAPSNKLHWYQKCSDFYPCICKSLPSGGHFQTDTADDVTKTPGLKFGWNCDNSASSPARVYTGQLAGFTVDRKVSWIEADTDTVKLRLSDACTTERTHSFGGVVRGRDEADTGYYKTWELELPQGNGEYEITIMTGGFSWGCVVENYRASDSTNRGGTTRPAIMRRIVRDGRLTLTGHSLKCAPIAYIKIKKIAHDDLQMIPITFPSSTDIVWEREIMGNDVLVGDVVLGGPSVPNILPNGKFNREKQYTCEMGFMLGQDYCVPTPYGGTFVQSSENVQQGVIVSLADEPCVFDHDGSSTSSSASSIATCPPPKHVCAHVVTPTMCVLDETTEDEPLCPIRVRCGGIRARYVRVELPGKHRILHVDFKSDIKIYRDVPNPNDVSIGDFAAYSVAVATPTLTRPEYTISTDPTDPIFYSTCFTYQIRRKFRSIKDAPPPLQWNYNGRCLDCENYHEHMRKFNITRPDAPTTKWMLSNTCQNCLETAPVQFAIDAGDHTGSNAGDQCTKGSNGQECQNGGVATGITGSCGCTCADGYEGDNCQTASACYLKDTGAPGTIDCKHGGAPQGTTGSCACQCLAGYSGGLCNTADPVPGGSNDSPATPTAEFHSDDQLMHVTMHHHTSDGISRRLGAAFLDFTVTYEGNHGWFAVGVSETGKMFSGGDTGGSDIFACEFGGKVGTSEGDTVSTVHRYWVTARDTSWVMNGLESMLDSSCEFSNGKGVLKFRRGLKKEASQQREIKLGEETHFIWSHGTSAAIGYHQNRGTLSLIVPAPPAGEDGGNSDGGNSDGGNSDGGNSDGGNSDGGNSDGGNSGGGNSDGSNSDGGNSDGSSDSSGDGSNTKSASGEDGAVAGTRADGRGSSVSSADQQNSAGNSTSSWGFVLFGVLVVAAVVAAVVGIIVLRKKRRNSELYSHFKRGSGSKADSAPPAIAMVEKFPQGVAVELSPIQKPVSTGEIKLKNSDAPSDMKFAASLAAPPSEGQRSRRVVRKPKRTTVGGSLADDKFVDTPFGTGKVLFVRKFDGCQVVELPWKLAQDSKVLLYRFSSD